MTRTHFKAISSLISGSTMQNDKEYIDKRYLIEGLCDYLELTNDRFNKGLFISACYKE